MTSSQGTGRKLTAELVVRAYCAGAFPMANPRSGHIEWFSPDPRGLLPLDVDRFHVPKSLRRRMRSGRYHITFDCAFDRVIRACAGPRRHEPETWINEDIVAVYNELHDAGLAHSVEAWVAPDHVDAEALTGAQDGDVALVLAGGLYGVALGGAFFGESMFSRRTDASKVCLVKLVEHLRTHGFMLLDTQFFNPHLAQFGMYEMSHEAYMRQLNEALDMDVTW